VEVEQLLEQMKFTVPKQKTQAAGGNFKFKS
jgi:hypothetical protein